MVSLCSVGLQSAGFKQGGAKLFSTCTCRMSCILSEHSSGSGHSDYSARKSICKNMSGVCGTDRFATYYDTQGIFLFGQHIDLLELVQTTELDGELNLG